MSRRRIFWARLLSVLSWLLWVSAASATTHELYQVSGSVFALEPAPAEDSFRYGPFDSLDRDARFQRLLTRFGERLANQSVPGGAIAVVIDGRLSYSAGVGLLRSTATAPAQAESRFRSASLSKMLLAATLLSLVERDGVELEHPLADYLPAFARARGDGAALLTPRMLLDHTAGFPVPDDARSRSLSEAIAVHASDALLSPPGRLFNYSNAGYAWIAALIEAKTGRKFEELVAERVFFPAHMTSASYASDASEANVSAGHDARGHVIWTRPRDSAASRAAGGVIASVVDYAHFCEALLAGGGAMLSPASARSMMSGHALMQDAPRKLYGFGLFETEQAGLRVVEHAGSSSGFSSLLRMVPSQGFAVVVFDNGMFAPDEVADAAMSAFLDVPEAPRARVVTSPESWAAYVGRYEDVNGALGRFDVRLRDGHLWLELRARQRAKLPRTLRGRFELDANGKVEYFVTRLGVARRLQQ